MFTGIIETLGEIKALHKDGGNVHVTLASSITNELKIDQSVAHNGVCLTVVEIFDDNYVVTAIKETLDKTNLDKLSVDEEVNIERAMKLGDRLDGHIVQGHVDQTGQVQAIVTENGSWRYTIAYDASLGNVTVEKGSICVNGISLTVVDSTMNTFSVAIIPYTYEHTVFKYLAVGGRVNIEFDILGNHCKRFWHS